MPDSRFVSIQPTELDRIPCLVVRPKGENRPLPVVILYHGWHSSKEFEQTSASMLASYGFTVVAPDAPNHGERGTIDYDDPQVLMECFWPIIFQSVEESDGLLAAIRREKWAGSGRISVAGSSMGGFIAAGVFVRHPELRCLVNLLGSCAWVKSEAVWRRLEGRPPASEAEVERLARFDPWQRIDRLHERPVLMLHGDSDPVVPVDGQRFFYRQVAPMYSECPERLNLIETPGLGHAVTVNMLEETANWLQQYG